MHQPSLHSVCGLSILELQKQYIFIILLIICFKTNQYVNKITGLHVVFQNWSHSVFYLIVSPNWLESFECPFVLQCVNNKLKTCL